MASTTGNAFTNPSAAKIDQQRKILEELEKRKKQLNQQSASGLVVSTTSSMNNSNSLTTAGNSSISATPSNSSTSSVSPASSVLTEGQHSGLNNNQRAALEVATKSSFGYFIPQDSNFGNLILPVIPRQ